MQGSVQTCQHVKEIRMNHDVVETFRKKLERFTLSDYHGLQSPGLTCYLNSVLQVLFMTEDFREAVKECCSEDSTTIESHLAKLFADLEKEMAQTHKIIRKLGITNVYEQRDAAEYFEKILCLTNPDASKIFKGELNHRTSCLKCKQTSETRSFFWFLPLVVEDSCRQIFSVEKGLEAFFKGEIFCGDNKVYCKQCKKKRDADFGCEMTQNPQILTLLLKRFSFDYEHGRYVKLCCEVEVPKNIHIEDCEYDLYALVHHFGDLTGGHYTAQIKSFETQGWYHFNDDRVKGMRKALFGAGRKSLSSRTAYLLMYRKVRKPPEASRVGDLKACCTYSDGEAEGGETPVPRRLLDVERNAEEKFRHLNGEVLEPRHDDANHLNHREGPPPAQPKPKHGDCMLETQRDTRRKRATANETQKNTDAKTDVTRGNETDGVEPAGSTVVKNKMGNDNSRKKAATQTVPKSTAKREPWRC